MTNIAQQTEIITTEAIAIGSVTTDDERRRAQLRADRIAYVRNAALWWVLRIIFFVAILFLWETAASQGWIDKFFFSTPSDIGAFLLTFFSTGAFIEPVVATVQETVYAFLLGSAAGIISGILLTRFVRVRKLVSPFLTALNALPRVALAPLFILWFGIGLESKVFLGASLVYFVVLIATEGAINTVDPEYVKVVDSLGANHRHRLTYVILPSIVPPVFSGLRVGVIYALLGVVTAEMVASRVGLGQLVVYYSSIFRTDGVMAILFVLAIVALIINGILEFFERKLNAWRA